MKPLRILSAAGVIFVSLPACAQEGPIMRAGDVTEEALTRALAPDAGAFEPTSKSIRVTPDVGTPKPPKRAPQASILITFDTDSAVLTHQSEVAIDKVAKAFQNDTLGALRFDVEGHADPRGGAASNLALSRLRAESVVNYLVAKHGINPSRLVAVGKGDTELANRANPTAPENRRVTFKTLK
jgi:OmpA-OmpF porin, OOP family